MKFYPTLPASVTNFDCINSKSKSYPLSNLKVSKGPFTRDIYRDFRCVAMAISIARKIRTREQPAILSRFCKFTSLRYRRCFEHV